MGGNRTLCKGQLGCSQAVRHRFLIPTCGGSNPPTPANYSYPPRCWEKASMTRSISAPVKISESDMWSISRSRLLVSKCPLGVAAVSFCGVYLMSLSHEIKLLGFGICCQSFCVIVKLPSRLPDVLMNKNRLSLTQIHKWYLYFLLWFSAWLVTSPIISPHFIRKLLNEYEHQQNAVLQLTLFWFLYLQSYLPRAWPYYFFHHARATHFYRRCAHAWCQIMCQNFLAHIFW